MHITPARLVLAVCAAAIVAIATHRFFAGHEDAALFPGIAGPDVATPIPSPQPANWQQYGEGGTSSLAILLTDADSAWLGLAHGLKSIGVPFRITRDATEALRHRVVLVYPTISGKVLDPDTLRALAAFPRNGGTLIGFNVAGGGLEPVFGFEHAVDDRSRTALRFNTASPVTAEFTDPRERGIPLNGNQRSSIDMGVVSYAGPRFAPLATYDNGEAAILHRQVGIGHAYAFGLDLGFFLLKGYNNRQQGIARAYVNEFEPALDVLLRLLRNIYRQGEPDALTLGTVPRGRSLSVILTHDIDYTESVRNAVAYAEHEKGVGISATHFVQTKYVRDWNDDAFFKPDLLDTLNRIAGLGMEIGSHSVSHSRVFSRFETGSGRERYPDYRPFVRGAEHTENGSVLDELRVSRFLLGRLTHAGDPVSFRPGHLQHPFVLPQALQATGYRYSSSVTANTAMTHLPFRLTWGRETTAQTPIYEFPITVEDELPPRLGDRLPQALALAERLSRYGGLYVVLIHPNILGHKLDFQKRLVAALKNQAWFGSLREFGDWWSARDKIIWKVEAEGSHRRVILDLPQAVAVLPLQLPPNYRWIPDQAIAAESVTQRMLLLKQASAGRLTLEFEVQGATP